MNLIKKGFGKNLKETRKRRKLTQEILSEKIGINLRQLARIESGDSFVTAETLEKICREMSVSPSSLFDFSLVNVQSDMQNLKEYKDLKEKIISIADDKSKLEFMLLAFRALSDKKSLIKLQYLIKGIELSKQK